MKTLRLALMVLGAPALTLLALHQLGETPIARGYDTGFHWRVDVVNSRLVLSVQPEGDLSCWVRIKIPQTKSPLRAWTSANDEIQVRKESDEGGDQRIALEGKSQSPQGKFNWPAGVDVYVSTSDGAALRVDDWYVFPSNKSFDSKQRACWRGTLFWIATVLLLVALSGAVLEGLDRLRPKRERFSPELCVKGIIRSVEGFDSQETERMRGVLERVLIEGTRVEDALAPLPFSNPHKAQQFWIRTAGQFRTKLEFLITELARYWDRLKVKQ